MNEVSRPLQVGGRLRYGERKRKKTGSGQVVPAHDHPQT